MWGRHLIRVFLSCLIVLMIAGCRSQRIGIQQNESRLEYSQNQLIDLLNNSPDRFLTLKIRKAQARLSLNGKTEEARANIAIYRDSLIAVSVIPALGYEALRILCTRDSVIIINRRDKTYWNGNFKAFSKKFMIPVEFADVQAILANEVFYYRKFDDNVSSKTSIVPNTKKDIILIDSYSAGERFASQEMEISKQGQRLDRISIIDFEEKIKFELLYNDFKESPIGEFPKNIELDILYEDLELEIGLEYGVLDFNDSIRLEFSVPDNYTRDEF